MEKSNCESHFEDNSKEFSINGGYETESNEHPGNINDPAPTPGLNGGEEDP